MVRAGIRPAVRSRRGSQLERCVECSGLERRLRGREGPLRTTSSVGGQLDRRSRNAAAAATPPRAGPGPRTAPARRQRPVGPRLARARSRRVGPGQSRRRWHRQGQVDAVAILRRRGAVGGRRTSGWRTHAPCVVSSPASTAASTAVVSISRDFAAGCSRTGSPSGSAVATRTRSWVSDGRRWSAARSPLRSWWRSGCSRGNRAAGELGGVPPSRELEERERVAVALGTIRHRRPHPTGRSGSPAAGRVRRDR